MPDDLRCSWCNNNRNKGKINIMCLTHHQNHPPRPQPIQKLSSTKLVSSAKTIRYCFCRLCLTHSPPALLTLEAVVSIPWSCIKRSHFLKIHKSANFNHLAELPFFYASFITWKTFRHLKKTKSRMCLQLMLLTTCKNHY